jgi:hypothetical protein
MNTSAAPLNLDGLLLEGDSFGPIMLGAHVVPAGDVAVICRTGSLTTNQSCDLLFPFEETLASLQWLHLTDGTNVFDRIEEDVFLAPSATQSLSLSAGVFDLDNLHLHNNRRHVWCPSAPANSPGEVNDQACTITPPELRDPVDGPPLGATVRITNLVVTARTLGGGGEGFWAQAASSPEPNNGLFVSGMIVAVPNEGDRVTVIGEIAGDIAYRQINAPTVAVYETGITLPDPVALPLDQVNADLLPYLGMLCRVEMVTAVSMTDSAGVFYVTPQSGGGSQLIVDDTLHGHSANEDDNFNSITGVLHYADGALRLLPRRDGDIATGF